jgi:Flp pilus assembly protein protease CpaA
MEMAFVQRILMDAFFIVLLIWCAYTDIRKRTVSNVSIILLLCLALAHTVLIALAGNSWWIYPAGLALAVPFLIVWLKNGIGAGDVKLLMGIGLYLGLTNTVIAFALMVSVMAAICIRSWIRNKTLKQRIPFAPILAVGAIGVTVSGYVYALVCI